MNDPYIFDYDLSGSVDSQGKIKEVYNEDALINSVKLWIASLGNERLRNPGSGGYILPLLMKPMIEVDSEQLEMAMRDGFEQDFSPILKLLDLKITADLQKRRWLFQATVYSPSLNLVARLNEPIRGQ